MPNSEDAEGTGGAGRPARYTDDQWADRCAATEADATVLDDVIQGRIARGAIARTIGLRIKLRYGHAVPKGEAIKPEALRPTVYVLEVPAGTKPGDSTPPPVGVGRLRAIEPSSVNSGSDSSNKG